MSITSPHISGKQWLLLCLSLLIIAFVYIYRIGDKAPDFDERYSINIATGIGGTTSSYASFGRFVVNPIPGATFTAAQYRERFCLSNTVGTAMNDNGQGLPYFTLLHGWLKLTGVSGFNARLPSALLMLAALLLLYTLLVRWTGNSTLALLAIILFGCNGVVIGLAQYARFYSLGVLLTVVSLHLMWRTLMQEPAKQSWLLGFVWGIMFLNQFFAAFIIAAEAIFLFPVFRKTSFRLLASLLLGALPVVLIWMIPLHGWESLRNIYTLNRSNRLGVPELTTRAGLLNTTGAWLSSLTAAVGQPIGAMSSGRSLLIQLAAGLPALLLIGISYRSYSKLIWARFCLLALLIYSAASLLHTFITGFNLLFEGRYWLFAYTCSYALLGWSIYTAIQKRNRLRGFALFVLCLTAGRTLYTSASMITGLSLGREGHLIPARIQPYEDYEGVAKTLVQVTQPGDTVSYESWLVAQRVNWFLLQHPELTQRVDTTQHTPVMICNGALRNAIPVGLGTTKSARRVWELQGKN
jgi:4-amino-4-deoxy-L-arabinose transferase-like glycosyltransferase